MGICAGGEYLSGSGAVEALNYARIHNIPIIVSSWGGNEYSQALFEAIRDYGGLYVAAAGNDNNRNNDLIPVYPSGFNLPNIIAVASTDSSDNLSVFSNYGRQSVQIAAPGTSVLSTHRLAAYTRMSGTSMAVPHVAGVAALLLAQNPTLGPQQLINVIISTARTVPSLAGRVSSGGIVDAYAALQFYSEAIIEPPAEPRNFTATPGPNSTQVTLSWSSPVNDGGSAITRYEVSMNNGISWVTASRNTGHTFSGLINGVTYTFLVRAVNSAGIGASARQTARAYDSVELFVMRLYTIVLGRDYDPAGLQMWTNTLKSRVHTGASVAHGFFFSSEFIDRRVSNEEFVRILYRTFLNREADPQGEATWLNNLRSGLPRENVFGGFTNSAEFGMLCAEAGILRGTYTPPPGGQIRVFVTRLYRTTLQREPDPGGLNTWTNALRNNVHTGASAAHGFIFSDEMFRRNLSNEDFVEIMYNALMGRASDPQGKNTWVTNLRNGVSRHSIFVSFVNSSEFDRICRDHGIARGTSPPQRLNPFPSSNTLDGKVIILDPGHGTSGSPGWGAYNEAVTMLRLAQILRPLLESQGATVILTRENEINIPISVRCARINILALETVRNTQTNTAEINEINRLIGIMQGIVNDPRGQGNVYMNVDPFDARRRIHPDLQRIFEITNAPVIRDNFLMISLHSNATGDGNTSARGAEVYFIDPNARANTMTYYPGFSFTAQSRAFGDILLDNIAGTGIPRRTNGLRAENYAMIREINMPAVLAENGFHTNAADRALLMNPSFLDNLAVAYRNSISSYFR
jgi:N-acetylmuramoyl-L-alanine amidase